MTASTPPALTTSGRSEGSQAVDTAETSLTSTSSAGEGRLERLIVRERSRGAGRRRTAAWIAASAPRSRPT